MVVANATAPGTLLLTSLTPYTRYIVQVEACTQFGCTVSDLVSMRTLEGGEHLKNNVIYIYFCEPFLVISYTYAVYHVIMSDNLTLHTVPSGLASPFVTITGPTSANITWGKYHNTPTITPM